MRWIAGFPAAPRSRIPRCRVADALRNAGVRGLVRQFRTELPGYGGARFDLAVPELRWAIEIDLHPVHRDLMGITSDRRRYDAAAAIGWSTSRIDDDAYAYRFNETIAELAAIHTRRRFRAAS